MTMTTTTIDQPAVHPEPAPTTAPTTAPAADPDRCRCAEASPEAVARVTTGSRRKGLALRWSRNGAERMAATWEIQW